MLSYIRGGTEKIVRYYDSKDIRQNNLDLLRLLFAYGVVYFHSLILSGTKAQLIPLFYSVDTAVQGFFLISGYLVFSSYERSDSVASYFAKRARRIYPAYFFVVLVSAFGLYTVSSENAAGYFSASWLKYVIANLTFLNFAAPILPGVFSQNLAPAVNGSLWTIKVEVAFYLAVPLLVAAMRWRGRLAVIVFLYVSSYLYFLTFKTLATQTGHGIYEELAKQFPGQIRYFVLGAAIYYYGAWIQKYLGLLGLAALLIACLVDIENLWFWKPILIACMVFAVAFGPFLLNVGRVGDLSYAAYLIHFPIIQLAIGFGMFQASPLLSILAILVVVTVLAYVSWHLIEKPFLTKSSHYVRAETNATNAL